MDPQGTLFQDHESDPEALGRDSAKRALDELFSLALKYRTSEEYLNLLVFVTRFGSYSPFNAMLVHVQMPGATYVAPASRWLKKYGRAIAPGARPLVILQPMGPVMFVFDVSETEPLPDAPKLPIEVTDPFEVRRGRVGNEFSLTIENAKRDGVCVGEREAGSQSAGEIAKARPGSSQAFTLAARPDRPAPILPVVYQLLLNQRHSAEAKYATLAHELGHLYCGHLGTPNERWWPNRPRASRAECEFEAESVCYLVCTRLGIDNPSDSYLGDYFQHTDRVPDMSLDAVLKASGLIERMGRERMSVRSPKSRASGE